MRSPTAYTSASTGHFLLWKKGIRHYNICVKNLTWDDRRKVGVLDGFASARLEGQEGIGDDVEEARNFRSSDLGSDEKPYKGISRLYRHDAESFWRSLVYLTLTTIEGEDGKNRTEDSLNPMRFPTDWIKRSYWQEERSGPRLVYLNAIGLVRVLQDHWVTRYFKRSEERFSHFRPGKYKKVEPPLQEDPDDIIFSEVVAIHERTLGSQEALCGVKEEFSKMYVEYQQVAVEFSN